jgi:hypothetical protein
VGGGDEPAEHGARDCLARDRFTALCGDAVAVPSSIHGGDSA